MIDSKNVGSKICVHAKYELMRMLFRSLFNVFFSPSKHEKLQFDKSVGFISISILSISLISIVSIAILKVSILLSILSMIIFASDVSLTATGIVTLPRGLLLSLTVKEEVEVNVPFSGVVPDQELDFSTSKSAISLSRFFNWTGLTLKAPYLASLEIILSTTME